MFNAALVANKRIPYGLSVNVSIAFFLKHVYACFFALPGWLPFHSSVVSLKYNIFAINPVCKTNYLHDITLQMWLIVVMFCSLWLIWLAIWRRSRRVWEKKDWRCSRTWWFSPTSCRTSAAWLHHTMRACTVALTTVQHPSWRQWTFAWSPPLSSVSCTHQHLTRAGRSCRGRCMAYQANMTVYLHVCRSCWRIFIHSDGDYTKIFELN